MAFSCALNGTCEPDPNGLHPDLATCQANCHSYEGDILPDLLYDILAFNLEDIDELAPSDIDSILFRLTGIRVPLYQVRDVLTHVIDKDYIPLWSYYDAKPYVRLQIKDELDLLILDTVPSDIGSQPDWQGLRNKVARLLTRTFQERNNDDVSEGLIDAEPETLEELITIIQQFLANSLQRLVKPSDNDDVYPNIDGFMSHWDYIVERFGPIIPYQRYIVD